MKGKPDSVYERIFEAVAKKVSPTKEESEREKRFAAELQRKLQKSFGKKAQLFFVGSTARDTGVRGDKDIDLFVAFPKEKSKEFIVNETVKAVKRTIPAKWEMHYAEHPYLQAEVQGFKVEVIPCFKIEINEGIISAVDRTPLHAVYLQKHLSEKQKRDVRVLKALLKAHDVYGAELEVEGFSGLVCEYLILNYRSLSNLLKSAAEWKPPVVLDIEDYYDQEYGQLKKRFTTPLIIMDFIDKNRNAAAAVSPQSFAKFISLSRAFLKNPSEKFFERAEPKFSPEKLLAELKGRNLILIRMKKPQNVISDILIPQLRRSAASVVKQLHLAEFKAFNQFSLTSEKDACVLIELESFENYSLKKISGPPVFMQKDLQSFLKKHAKARRGPFIDGERVVVEEERELKNALQVLQKIKGAPQNYGIASHFLKPMKNAAFLHKENLLKELRGNTALQQSLAKFFFRKDAL